MFSVNLLFRCGIFFVLFPEIALAREPSDSNTAYKNDSLRMQQNRWHWILYYDIHSTFTADFSTRFKPPQAPLQLMFYYNLDVKSRFSFRGWLFETCLFNDYGFTWFVDSLRQKTTDHLNYKFSLGKTVFKHIALDASVNTQTVLFPGYQYRERNQIMEAYRYESFMSPGNLFIGSGFSYLNKKQMHFQWALAGLNMTRIRDTSLFASRETNSISGIPRGKDQVWEGGMQFQITCPLNKVYRECYAEGSMLFFVPLYGGEPKLNINAVAHIKLWRFGRLSWRHALHYAEHEERPWLYRQWITLGAYLNNHLK